MANQEVRKERQRIIRDYLLKYPNKSLESIRLHLKTQDKHFSLATIHRDRGKLGFEYTDKKYVLINPQDEETLENLKLINIFGFDPPTIKGPTNSLYFVSIRTPKGTSSQISKIIDSLYENEILGTIAGDRLILILTTEKSQAKKISKKLETLKNISLNSNKKQ